MPAPCPPPPLCSTYQPIWDAFGRLLEPLSSSIPFSFIQGGSRGGRLAARACMHAMV